MQLNHLTRDRRMRKKKIIGRGGKRGTTAGRGTKGQRARAGHRIRPEIRDEIKKLPRRRGRGTNPLKRFRPGPVVIPFARLEAHFKDGEIVTPSRLVAVGLVSRERGQVPPVKILGGAGSKHHFKIEGCILSRSVAAALTTKK